MKYVYIVERIVSAVYDVREYPILFTTDEQAAESLAEELNRKVERPKELLKQLESIVDIDDFEYEFDDIDYDELMGMLSMASGMSIKDVELAYNQRYVYDEIYYEVSKYELDKRYDK